ncbi:MAG: RibD C-terminal domain, partial [Actinomycetota bacterium]
RIVCEGGEQLLTELLAQNLIDELDITYSPVSLGSQAQVTPLTNAISKWPNRITAKLGSDQVARIKR